MTRIEAINEVLYMVNESFINSLDEMSDEAQNASDLLDMVTRETCSDQEPFNIFPMTLKSDVNGEIRLNSKIMSAEVLNNSGQYRLMGNRMYNVQSKSFSINGNLDCDCKILLSFEELDPIIQNYVIKKVSVKKVSVDLGNKDLTSMAMNDLNIARSSYIQHNIDLINANFDNESFNSLFKRYYEVII